MPMMQKRGRKQFLKKIGLLTYHRATNYGALLQAYSLSNKLMKDLPQAKIEILDYSTKAAQKSHCRSLARTTLIMGPGMGCREWKRNNRFTTFSNNLPLSSFKIIDDNPQQFFEKIKGQYDMLICGSDAIFNWQGNTFPTAYFLGEDLGCPIMSYAASAHRMPFRQMTKEEQNYCKQAFERYSYLGIRDEVTQQMVEYCNPSLKTWHNCDPTVLLNMEEIKVRNFEYVLARYGIDPQKPIIALMTSNEIIADYILKRYGRDYQVVALFVPNSKIKLHAIDMTPQEWATFFSYAAFTVTEYFHATLLSLKNGTPVISFDSQDYTTGYEGKIRDLLLRRLNLPEMYFRMSDLHDNNLWKKIYETADRGIDGEFTDRIYQSLNNESQYYNSFNETAKHILGVI